MLSENASSDAREERCRDILTLLPQESVAYFETNILGLEGCSPTSNYRTLPTWWCASDSCYRGRADQTHKKLLQSPWCLHSEDVQAEDGDRSPLVSYLAHQTSGSLAVSLALFGQGIHIYQWVVGG